MADKKWPGGHTNLCGMPSIVVYSSPAGTIFFSFNLINFFLLISHKEIMMRWEGSFLSCSKSVQGCEPMYSGEGNKWVSFE